VNAGAPPAQRNSLGRSLGLGEKLFATPTERRFVAAVDDGLELVEEGLLREIAFADEPHQGWAINRDRILNCGKTCMLLVPWRKPEMGYAY